MACGCRSKGNNQQQVNQAQQAITAAKIREERAKQQAKENAAAKK